MKYFFDTEFKEQPYTIDLISIGITSEKGDEYYAISKDFNLDEIWEDEWLNKNVLKTIHTDLSLMVTDQSKDLWKSFSKESLQNLLEWFGKTNKEIGEGIKAFVYEIDKNSIEFYAYFADYDWVVFCWLFGRMIDLPKGFPMYCKDLKQILDDNGLSTEWVKKYVPESKNAHNAIVDARWDLKLFNKIKKEVGQI